MLKYKSQGFTVVELIIVISIIGILATIGMVSWSGAQNSAKKNAAQTTIGKVKISLADYYTDKAYYPANKTPGICDVSNPVFSAADLYAEFCTGPNNTYYTYVPSPVSCDNSATKCTSYVLTAVKTIWSGTTDVTLTQ